MDVAVAAKMYEEGKTTRQVVAHFGISAQTARRRLLAFGVELRGTGRPTPALLKSKEWLEGQYVSLKRSTTDIAQELGCSARTVCAWIATHGIEARSVGSSKGHKRNTEASRKKMSLARRGKFMGDQNPNWKGGIALKDLDRGRYPYKVWTKAVKDRDGWECKECGSKDRLHAHHIKPWARYPELRYEIGNGVTLCHTCHEAAHGKGYKFRWPTRAEKPTSASAHIG